MGAACTRVRARSPSRHGAVMLYLPTFPPTDSPNLSLPLQKRHPRERGGGAEKGKTLPFDECFPNGSHKEERRALGRARWEAPAVGRARRCRCGRAAARSRVLVLSTVLKTVQSCNSERNTEGQNASIHAWRHATTTTTSTTTSTTRQDKI